MDTLHRSLAPDFPERLSHRHWFPGSGIPKITGLKSLSLNGMAYFPDTLKANYKLGTDIQYTFKLKNQHAGHRLPSGDPERFYTITLEWRDKNTGQIIASSENRIGETWEWYPEAKKLSDNNMEIGEERSYQLNLNPLALGKYILSTKVVKHRMDEKTAEYNGLGEEYPIAINDFLDIQEIEIVE
jgi:hypothetical protein